MNLKEKIEKNLTLSILALLLVGFLSGLGAYKTILEIAHLDSVPENTYITKDELDEKYVSKTKYKEVTDLKKLVNALKKDKPFIADYGPDVWIYRSFDVDKNKGAELKSCYFDECFTAKVSSVFMKVLDKAKGEEPAVTVDVEFPKPLYEDGSLKGMGITPIILKPGMWGSVRRPDYDYKVMVESVSFEKVRLGIAIRSGTSEPDSKGRPSFSFHYQFPE